jgi:hypothetical protein
MDGYQAQYMTARDGDGWVSVAVGNKHWGLNGAAGILIVVTKRF